MSELFIFSEDKKGNIFLDEEETRHCIKVCRHSVGETIEITDGKGKAYKAEIIHYGKKTSLKILKILSEQEAPERRIGFLLPLLHVRDRMEFAIEKLTELGITDFYLTHYARCQKSKQNVARLRKIVLSAAKQSRRFFFPEVHSVSSLEKHLQRIGKEFPFKSVATMRAISSPGFFGEDGNILLAVGPEGGLTLKELEIFQEYGFSEVSLGKSRLRSETASLILCCKTFL